MTLLRAGYVTAQDRLWQMDLFRRNARGELSEVLPNVPNSPALDQTNFIELCDSPRWLTRGCTSIATVARSPRGLRSRR